MKTDYMVSLKNVTLGSNRLDKKILDDISLEVREGEFVSIVGSNGSGKSSLLKVINGHYNIDLGSLSIAGFSGSELKAKRPEIIATITQNLQDSVFDDLTVLENIALALKTSVKTLRKDQTLKESLKDFNRNLPLMLCSKAKNLSGGEKQSLALFMVLRRKPKLLLLDEHTSALDPQTGERLMEKLAKHAKEQKLTILMVTHNHSHAENYGERLLVLTDGKFS